MTIYKTKNIVQLQTISQNLRFRQTVRIIFKNITSETIFDFQNIQTISRSFAHEYILLKSKSNHTISEINVPDVVTKMFTLVKNNHIKPRFDRKTWVVKNELVL